MDHEVEETQERRQTADDEQQVLLEGVQFLVLKVAAHRLDLMRQVIGAP